MARGEYERRPRRWLTAGVLIAGLVAAQTATAAPRYLRLSFTGDTATTMTVSWNTDANTASTVRYGTTSGSLTATANGATVQGPSGLGFIHEVTLTGLTPATGYFYVAGSDADGYSGEGQFTTGPVTDPRCGTFKFTFMGDNRPDPIFGGGANWPQILAQGWSQGPAFALNGGDLVIDGDRIDQWNEFLLNSAPVVANLPLMPCIGNHDDGPGEGDGANYNQIFALPRSTGTYGSDTEDYYYFTYGNAIFVSLSTHTYDGGTPRFQQQAAWLDEVLTANPRKWRFVYYHAPSYTKEVFFSISHAANEESQNAAFIPIIDKHHVDVVFTSHNHWYERFNPTACGTQGSASSGSPCPVGATNYAAGTVFYVSGGAGAFTIPAALCGSLTGRAKCSGDHHYVLASITDETLSLDTWAAHPQTHQVIDTITITKPGDSCLAPPPTDGGTPDAAPPADAGGSPDAAPPRDGSAALDGASSDGSSPATDAGAAAAPPAGCSCRAVPAPATLVPFALLAGALLARRRRRR